MAELVWPEDLGHGTFTGRFGFMDADGHDPDREPDIISATGGTVTITPSVKSVRYAGVDGPMILVARPAQGIIDREGYLCSSDGTRGMVFPATDDTDLTPTDWTYEVSVVLDGRVRLGTFNVKLPEGETVDLSLAAPVPASGGTAVVVDPSTATRAEAAATRAEAAAVAAEEWTPTFEWDGTYLVTDGVRSPSLKGEKGEKGDPGAPGPYGGTEVSDPQVASYVVAESDTRAAVDHLVQARHSAITRKLDGTRLLIIGDSISILGTSGVQGQSHTCWYQWESGGRLHEVARTAQSGARSDQQLADVRTYWEAGPSDPATLAICQVGTNDLNQGVPMETWLGYVHDIVTVNAQNGCDTVLCTIPPRSGPANPKPPSVVNGEWNAALRDYAYRNGVPVVDIWAALADPTTGEFRPGEVDPSDGVHPNYLGMRRMADEVKRTLYPLLAEPQELRQSAGVTTRVPGEPGGMLPTPIFTAPGDPGGLGFSTASPAGAWTSVWDPEAPGGYSIELDVTDPATRPDLMQQAAATGGGWASGDRLLAVARMRVISSQNIPPGYGIRVSLAQLPAGATAYGSFCFGQFLPTAEWQTVRFEFTPDPGATYIRWYFQYLKPPSTPGNKVRARIASMQIYNLTRMGIK